MQKRHLRRTSCEQLCWCSLACRCTPQSRKAQSPDPSQIGRRFGIHRRRLRSVARSRGGRAARGKAGPAVACGRRNGHTHKVQQGSRKAAKKEQQREGARFWCGWEAAACSNATGAATCSRRRKSVSTRCPLRTASPIRRMPWAPAIKASTKGRNNIIVTTTVYLGRFAVLLQVVATSALLMTAASKASAASNSNQPNTQGSGNTTTALDILNPWLSACDLVQPNTDLQGTCSATEVESPPPHGPGPPQTNIQPSQSAKTSAFACPPSCPTKFHVTAARHDQNITNQCLYYLQESHKDELCERGKIIAGGGVRAVLSRLRLRHCCEHDVTSAMTPESLQAVASGGRNCQKHLGALLDTDAMAARISCEFNEVLTRYDCGQNYSIVHHCGDCKVNTIPFYNILYKPLRSNAFLLFHVRNLTSEVRLCHLK